MDSGHFFKATQKNPRETANIFSVIFMTFTFGLYKKRIKRELTLEDMWVPLKDLRSDFLGSLLECKWKEELSQYKRTGKKPNLLRILLKMFSKNFVYSSLAALFTETCVRVFQPLLLARLLRYFSNNGDISYEEALLTAAAILLISLLYIFFLAHYSLLMQTTFVGIKAAISTVVYRKVLCLSSSAVRSSTSGNIINLISSDMKVLRQCLWYIHYLWLTPLMFIPVSYFVCVWVAWPGAAVLVLVFVVTILLLSVERLAYAYKKLSAQKSDRRIKLIQEILLGVRLIKMYTWEKPFTYMVDMVRISETALLKKTAIFRGAYLVFVFCAYRVVCFCAMAIMTLLNYPLTAENVFTIAAFLTSLTALTSFFIRAFQEGTDALVSLNRIQKFLLNEELTDKSNRAKNVSEVVSGDPVIMKNVTTTWNNLHTHMTLSDINLRVRRGSLVVVIGQVGCGKSSLLQAVLGELPLVKGEVSVEGKIAYANQEPWVFGDTVRQNITFARPYEKELYDKVIEVCALQQDFLVLPRGDMTIVGEKGCSLSGGQKARINLARTVYSGADVYLLDDPLSAVDSHVAKHLFDSCIMQFLKGKTRLLVTHQIQFLQDADYIVVMKNGGIEIQGTFTDLMKSNFDSARYVKKQENIQKDDKDFEDDPDNIFEEINITDSHDVALQNYAETSLREKLKMSVYFEYFLSGSSSFRLFIVLMIFILSQVVANACDYWMLYWTKQQQMNYSDRYLYKISEAGANGTEDVTLTENLESLSLNEDWTSSNVFYVSVHGLLIVVLLFLSTLRMVMFYNICEACSNVIHKHVMNSIIRTHVKFFDINPSGRILSRLSADVAIMDEPLPKAMSDTAQYSLYAIGPFVLATIINYRLIIVAIILVVIYCFALRIFVRTSTNIMRLEGISRSPVFVHMNATLEGLTTIRALKAEEELKKEFDQHQDLNTSANYAIFAVAKTLTLSSNLLSYVFFVVAIFSFFFMEKGDYGSEVGLVITQSLGLIMYINFAIIQFTLVPESFTCVERVLEYKYLEEEENLDSSPNDAVPACWPKDGCIEFRNVSLKYLSNGPRVLEDINFVINAGEKVGIVGRTGAGKSSLILALFIFAEVEGSILIDGINTKNISLQDLRKKISIIPQDPFLFSGTLRVNLDRFNEFQDYELLKALEDVEMKGVLTKTCGLSMAVADKGDNFSVGQKQLLCLARAILKKNKILVLDEATANVDLQTDELIQRTLREKFTDCTVLTVAHRLNTIMDSDKVIVMHRGHLVEFDHPHMLLQNTEGVFYKMVKKTGQLENLVKVASESYWKQKEIRKQR